ncbi:unnamed protein product [Amoebophrya sp. A25]|nr:unnamed protein product [Amoebophrya sp. A25]|eukprot:GSA25T00008204001.1
MNECISVRFALGRFACAFCQRRACRSSKGALSYVSYLILSYRFNINLCRSRLFSVHPSRYSSQTQMKA